MRTFLFDIDPLIYYGYYHRLEASDMYHEPTVTTERLVKKFEPAYEARKKAAPEEQPDLKRVLLAGNMGMFIFTGVLYLIAQV